MTSSGDVAVTEGLVLTAGELQWRYSTSGGPGGQHANTSNTRAEVVLDIASSPSLDDSQRQRLLDRIGPRLTVAADDTRSQHRNRELALARLVGRLQEALRDDPVRRPSRPSRGAKERRLQAKRRRSQVKADRRRPPPPE
jgi:ribosome-associated protein